MNMNAKNVALGLLLGSVGCGGGSAAVDPNALADGTHLTESLDVAAGTTISIAPGAHLLIDKDKTITIHGTLKVASGDGKHARIAPATAGDTWGGLVVAAGGTLDADGLDLDGTTKAVSVLPGATAARYDRGTISGVEVPFKVEPGARLDTAHATVVGATFASGISGEFHASYLDYEKAGLGGGIVMDDPGAVFEVADSTLHAAAGPGGGDYVISLSSKLVHVSYTTITGAHCGFHFDAVERFEIDHVTAGAASPGGPGGLNNYGAMLYGSGAGPNVISNSNFDDSEVNLDFSGTNGPLTIKNTFSTGKNSQADGTWTWAPADVAPAPIADAKPR
jgi:hypothetical protein